MGTDLFNEEERLFHGVKNSPGGFFRGGREFNVTAAAVVDVGCVTLIPRLRDTTGLTTGCIL